MARTPSSTDFSVDIEGEGTFTFARRTLRDEMRIAAEYSRLTEGVATPTDWLAIIAGCLSALTVLTVSAPDGWDLEALDPLDDDSYARIIRVHNALRAKEDSFRQGKSKASKGAGQGVGGESGVLVSPQVQPDAE